MGFFFSVDDDGLLCFSCVSVFWMGNARRVQSRNASCLDKGDWAGANAVLMILTLKQVPFRRMFGRWMMFMCI